MPDVGPPRGADVEGALLCRVAAGDVAAFDDLYGRCAAAVHGLVLTVLRDRAQSEEVTQEVFVEAWRSASRFDADRGGGRAWLLTIARRRAVDRVRASQAAADRDLRVGVRDFAPAFDDVVETVWRRVEHARVRACLERLTAVQRQAVELAFYGGRSYREVSGVLGLPLGTVKTRLRDGLIRLRDCLGVDE